MDEAILGSIQAFAFSFAPYGWALCNGVTVPITQNTALFSLLGTTFGGDGKTTFGLPDLRGRTIIGTGNATAQTSVVAWGEKSGVQSVPLTTNNMPMHNHMLVNGDGLTVGTVKVNTTVVTVDNTNESPETNNGENVLGTAGSMPSIYRESPTGTDSLGGVESKITGSTSFVGSSSVNLDIRNPYLGLYYCIATMGYYPTRP